MLEWIGEPAAIILIGLVGGVVLGLAARVKGFCTLGMIEDVHYGHTSARLWLWIGALGAAILCTFALSAAGVLDLASVIYLQNSFSIAGAILGGLLFGYGMAQTGNCGFTALARVGGGDLRAFMIAMVMGVTAMIALSGMLAMWRLNVFPVTPQTQGASGLAHVLGDALNLSPNAIGMAIGAIMIIAAIAFAPRKGATSRIIWSLAIGGTISFGFLGTHWVSINGWEAWPVVSHTFTAPIGETIHYAMFSTGLAPKFGMGSVLGVVLGGFIGSLIKGGFRWEACEDPRELRRQIVGAAVMGLGAVLAAGCSIGQGLSAFSVLSATAPLVAASIWIGAWFGLRQLLLGLAPEV